MFYSQSLLSRNGPFGNIWIAAYCLKKLNKHQIADTDITSAIDKIIPEVEIPYRVLAQLLLGVVRIFSKKVDHLYHDCNKALTNLRISFIPTCSTPQKRTDIVTRHNVQKKVIGEPQQNAKAPNEKAHSPEQNSCALQNETLAMQIEALCAPYHDAITLPEHFELDAFDLDVRDRGDAAKPYGESTLEDEFVHGRDEWTNENDQHCFLNERHQMEVDIRAEYNSACFTPVEDVIPYTMMNLEIDEFHNSCNLEVSGRVEKSKSLEGLRACSHPVAYLHDDHDHVNSVNPQDIMPSDIQGEVQCDVSKNQVMPGNSHGSTPTCNKESHNPTNGNTDAQDKSEVPVDSGLPSPKFAVRTPARRETRQNTHKNLKKRRILFDETIVLSNGTMRMWINDASNLVCKRRKAPHTSLDAWKACRITDLQNIFLEPVIPYVSCEHKAIIHKCSSGYFPQKKSSNSSADAINLQNEISNKPIEPHDSFQGGTISDTPPADIFSGISTPERSELRMESFPIGIGTSALDTADKDQGSSEKENNDQDGGCSVRTRAVAKYLYDRFGDLKEQKREEFLNLDQILQGQTRAKSARFFYETLTLKTDGCLDVKQDSTYGAIVVSATPQLEVLVKKNPCQIGAECGNFADHHPCRL